MMSDLYPYQEEGVDFLVECERGMLADDMGLGKSVQAIRAAEVLGAFPLMIVSPASAIYNWKNEVEKWGDHLRVQVIDGTPAQRAKQWRTAGAVRGAVPGIDVVSVSYETLLRDLDGPEVSPTHWRGLILDECHKLKNRKTKVFTAFKKLARSIPVVFELTGTPVQKSPESIWSLLYLLDPTAHSSFWAFVRRYCYVVFDGFKMDIGDIVHPDELAEHVAKYVLRREKDSLGDQLPEKTVQQMWLKLDADQEHKYIQMEDEYFTTIEGQDLAAVNTISMNQFLRRITIDPTLAQEECEAPLKGAKIRALFDILEGLAGDPAVIFTTSARAAKRLWWQMIEMGYNVGALWGETDKKLRAELNKSFQEGKLDYLICTIRAGGQSINLTRASTAIFLDKDWVPEINAQAQDRLHRIGQKDHVHIIELLAYGTIDERVEELQVRGRTLSAQTLRDATRKA